MHLRGDRHRPAPADPAVGRHRYRQPDEPSERAEIANGEGVEIYKIGVVDPDATGEDRVDLVTLEDVAARTGGEYFFASDQDALTQVYARIDDLPP
jgi:Ca-activated chloride channel homolog